MEEKSRNKIENIKLEIKGKHTNIWCSLNIWNTAGKSTISHNISFSNCKN